MGLFKKSQTEMKDAYMQKIQDAVLKHQNANALDKALSTILKQARKLPHNKYTTVSAFANVIKTNRAKQDARRAKAGAKMEAKPSAKKGTIQWSALFKRTEKTPSEIKDTYMQKIHNASLKKMNVFKFQDTLLNILQKAHDDLPHNKFRVLAAYANAVETNRIMTMHKKARMASSKGVAHPPNYHAGLWPFVLKRAKERMPGAFKY